MGSSFCGDNFSPLQNKRLPGKLPTYDTREYNPKRKKKKGRKEGRWQHMPISKLGTVKQETVTESGQLLLSEYQASQEETEKK